MEPINHCVRLSARRRVCAHYTVSPDLVFTRPLKKESLYGGNVPGLREKMLCRGWVVNYRTEFKLNINGEYKVSMTSRTINNGNAFKTMAL